MALLCSKVIPKALKYGQELINVKAEGGGEGENDEKKKKQLQGKIRTKVLMQQIHAHSKKKVCTGAH